MTPAEKSRAIIEEVAAGHGLTVADLLGPSRFQEIVRARDEAIARLHEERKLSAAQIAPLMNRDRTSILAALDRPRYRAVKRTWDRRKAAERAGASA
jgi:chromosomal replication initiation ATPase DnaA